MGSKMLGHYYLFDFIVSSSSGMVNIPIVSYPSQRIHSESADNMAKLCKHYFITFNSVLF